MKALLLFLPLPAISLLLSSCATGPNASRGTAAGAIAGAVVAGPVGAVAGGAVGNAYGNEADRGRRR